MNPLDAAINAVNASYQPTGAPYDTALIVAKCRGLLRGYARRWLAEDQEMAVLEVEKVLVAPQTNPKTLHTSPKLRVAGKLDLVLGSNGKRFLWDHKSTSEEIDDLAGAYWRQLTVESQPTHYHWLQWLVGVKLDGAIWDVVRKPGINPRKLARKAIEEIAASSTYCGFWLDARMVLEAQTSERENLELYEARLVQETTKNPDRYYQRREVPRLDDEISEYAHELWDAGQIILEARRKDRWPKHPSGCMSYGRPCGYLGICSGFDTPGSANWSRRQEVHPELQGSPASLEHNTLTNSSVRCYQQCPRKYFYRYELGLLRNGEQEAETLYFGSLLHAGLEAYWKALRESRQPAAEPEVQEEPEWEELPF